MPNPSSVRNSEPVFYDIQVELNRLTERAIHTAAEAVNVDEELHGPAQTSATPPEGSKPQLPFVPYCLARIQDVERCLNTVDYVLKHIQRSSEMLEEEIP